MVAGKSYRFSDVITLISCFLSFYFFVQLILLRDEQALDIQDAFGEIQQNKMEHKKLPIDLNRSKTVNEQLLLVTQISRSGSSSLQHLLKELKIINNFIITSTLVEKDHIINVPKINKQKQIAKKISTINETSAVLSSFAYINFTRFDLLRPLQVAIIRDPIERAISSYYFSRAPNYIVERHQMYPEIKFQDNHYFKKTLEACLLDTSDDECSYGTGDKKNNKITEIFCGHESFCRSSLSDVDALKKAKEVIETSYDVVGVLEHWNETLIVLENYAPKFFRNALRIYYEKIHEDALKTNRNKFRPSVETWVEEGLRKKFIAQLELYEFARQRLHEQYLRSLH